MHCGSYSSSPQYDCNILLPMAVVCIVIMETQPISSVFMCMHSSFSREQPFTGAVGIRCILCFIGLSEFFVWFFSSLNPKTFGHFCSINSRPNRTGTSTHSDTDFFSTPVRMSPLCFCVLIFWIPSYHFAKLKCYLTAMNAQDDQESLHLHRTYITLVWIKMMTQIAWMPVCLCAFWKGLFHLCD